MTGEVTLTGRVLPIGGLKEKLLAAYRMGIRNLLIPKANERDLEKIDSEVLEKLSITPVERVDEALDIVLEQKSERKREACHMIIKKAKFQTSLAEFKDFPGQGLPEIAFAGKSNVGKSSLINALTHNSKLARTSSEPGKTRLVNFFLLNDSFYLVDLPGYGFARASKQEKERWCRDDRRLSPEIRKPSPCRSSWSISATRPRRRIR